jgi:hypothetical protein
MTFVTKQPVPSVNAMVAVPLATPVTTPVVDPIVATAVLLLLQTALPEASTSVVAEPTQTLDDPEIGAGSALTVTTVVTKQPVGSVYEITAVPVATPVTTPVPLTVARELLLELHEPPTDEVLKPVVCPTHTVAVPVIGNGNGFTVIAYLVKQPVGNVYIIVSAPAANPVTEPAVGRTDAISGNILDHDPPTDEELKVIKDPTHTLPDPVIADGNGLTVISNVVIQPVGKV